MAARLLAETTSLVGQLERRAGALSAAASRGALKLPEAAGESCDELRAEVDRLKAELVLLEIKNGVRQVLLPQRVAAATKPTVARPTMATDPSVPAAASVTVTQAPPQPPAAASKKPQPIAAQKPASIQKAAPTEKAAPAEKPARDDPKHDTPDVSRLDLRVGFIVRADKHPDADGLYVEQVDVGDGNGRLRTIVSGLVKHVPLHNMQQRHAVFLCNLKAAKMRGVASEGMIMCAATADGAVEIIDPPPGAAPGDRVRCHGYDAPPDVQLNPKKHIWETVQKALLTDTDRRACYNGVPWQVEGKGFCVAPTAANGQIR